LSALRRHDSRGPDALIRQFDEFGDDYFRLSQIARISPKTYRQVAPKVERDTVSIDGREIEPQCRPHPRRH
jgi:hypothetical protein